MLDDSLELLVEFRIGHQARAGGSHFYRMGSKSWLRDRVPLLLHLAVPGGKTTICGQTRRFFDRIESDEVGFRGLPLCNVCRSISDPEWDGSDSALIVQGKMGWFRARPLSPPKHAQAQSTRQCGAPGYSFSSCSYHLDEK